MSEEMLEKLRNAKSAEEIVSIAKEYGREVTAEQAQELLDRLKAGASEGELSDDLLEAVAGGGYHRYRQGVVWKPFRQVIRRAARQSRSECRPGGGSWFCALPTQGAAMWFAPWILCEQ